MNDDAMADLRKRYADALWERDVARAAYEKADVECDFVDKEWQAAINEITAKERKALRDVIDHRNASE